MNPPPVPSSGWVLTPGLRHYRGSDGIRKPVDPNHRATGFSEAKRQLTALRTKTRAGLRRLRLRRLMEFFRGGAR